MMIFSNILRAETLPKSLKSDFSCMDREHQEQVAQCFKKQDLSKELESNSEEMDDVSSWQYYALAFFAGAFAGIYVLHH